MIVLHKATYRFNVIPIKLPTTFFRELGQKMLQCIWKGERPQMSKVILRKKNGAGGIKLLDFSCCSATQSCPTLCNPMDCSTPDFPVLHCLLGFA